MRRFFLKILSVFLTAVVLFTTTSFTANMHFCCEKLVSLSVTGEAKSCDEKLQNPENTSNKCTLGQKDCCSSDNFVNKGSDELQKVSFELDSLTFTFLKAFIYSYINLFEGLEENVVPFKNYKPPLIQKDLLVLHETFLI
ncbi:HYC_CC_PP family protein [Allomuricauda sp. ARW1Y1]|uniref:HYC_CC_PP family protein n=1 Tax=Allomuricauda sp. ARW1Y1 TaxID=2663843 RepID=UPI00391D3234